MLMNVIAVVVVTVLVGIGVWLADTIAEMERNQDCVLQGRQNCAPIEIPAPTVKRSGSQRASAEHATSAGKALSGTRRLPAFASPPGRQLNLAASFAIGGRCRPEGLAATGLVRAGGAIGAYYTVA